MLIFEPAASGVDDLLTTVDLEPAAAELERRIVGRFKTKTAPDGSQWEPWSPLYADTRGPGQSLLIDEGNLVDSIQAEQEGLTISVYSSESYAEAVDSKRRFAGASTADLIALEQLIFGGLGA
ncbi:MAG: phage virion morphogenesis protein [Mycobacterium sp.]